MNKEKFHNIHEDFTKTAFNNQDMLPDRYVFIITNLCNLKCDFCFQKKEPRKDAMSKESWLELVNQLPDYSRVTLTGGEPLLYSGFDIIFSKIAKKFNCNIISNGVLLTEKKIDFLLSFPKFKVLSISIDDIGNTVRGLTQQQWNHVIKMLKYFVKIRDEKNLDCVLDIKSTILDETASEMFNIYKYLREELKCDTHSFNLLKGSPMQHADHNYDFKDMFKKWEAPVYKKFNIIKKQLESVRQYNIDKGYISFLHPKVDSLVSEKKIPDLDYINKSDHIKNNFLNCMYPWSSVHINVDGSVFPCMAIPMGNVKDAPLKEIFFGENYMKFKDTIRKEKTVEGCNRCGWLKPKNLR